jgi:hypothetical protein
LLVEERTFRPRNVPEWLAVTMSLPSWSGMALRSGCWRVRRCWLWAAFANDGKVVTLAAPEDAHEPLSVLVIAGAPFHGPVLRYGPFVMNAEAEIRQALIDDQSALSASVLPVSPLSTGGSTTNLQSSSTSTFGGHSARMQPESSCRLGRLSPGSRWAPPSMMTPVYKENVPCGYMECTA